MLRCVKTKKKQEEPKEEEKKNFVHGNNLAPCEQLRMRLDLLRLKTYALTAKAYESRLFYTLNVDYDGYLYSLLP